MGISEGKLNQELTEKEAKKILKDALKRQHSLPREPGVDSSQLVKLAQDAGISEVNLNQSMQEYSERKIKRHKLSQTLGVGFLITSGLSALGVGVYAGMKKYNEPVAYVREVISSNIRVNDYSYEYVLEFKPENSTSADYIAIINCGNEVLGRSCSTRMNRLFNVIRKGSVIDVKKKELDKFEGGVGTLGSKGFKLVRR